MKHVMIDIETMGNESNSVITSIGAIQFDIETGRIFRTFHQHIKMDSCANAGLKMSSSTLLWWLQQSDEARKTLVEGQIKGQDIKTVLNQFSNWIRTLYVDDDHGINLDWIPINEIKVWGRGPRFDLGLLSDAYRVCGLIVPWNFRNELCVRTMEFLSPEIKKETINNGVAHDAIADCIYQIKYVSVIYKHLKEKNYGTNKIIGKDVLGGPFGF